MTFPKLALEGEAVNSKVPPDPASETVEGELDALLATERLPVALPAAAGAKLTGKVTLWPALRLKGKVTAPRLKPAPATAICETVTAADPVLLSATPCELVAPTVTLPKLTAAGLSDTVMVAPLPESGMTTGWLDALLEIETPPVEAAAVTGVKATAKLAALPEVNVTGSEGPLTLKPFPLAET